MTNKESFAVINNTAKQLMKHLEDNGLSPQRVMVYNYTSNGTTKRLPLIDRFKFTAPEDFKGLKCAFGYALENRDENGNCWAHLHRLPKEMNFSEVAEQLTGINKKIEKIHEYGLELEYLPSVEQTIDGQNIRISGTREDLEKYSKDVFPLDIFVHEKYGLTAYTSKDSWDTEELNNMNFGTREFNNVSGDTKVVEKPKKKDITYDDSLPF